MAFWSSTRIRSRHAREPLFHDVEQNAPVHLRDPDRRLKEASYTLTLGPEVYVTSFQTGQKRTLLSGEQVAIPPGQFAVLLTEEEVRIPKDAIGFISIRAGIKFRGLVNVSGFHVDPGFRGRLLFAVYNAGSEQIVLSRGDELFPIWFADLVNAEGPSEEEKAAYPATGAHAGQRSISSSVIMDIQGDVASPAALKKEIDDIRRTLSLYRMLAAALVATLLPAIISLYVDIFNPSKSNQRHEIAQQQVGAPPSPTGSQQGTSADRAPTPPRPAPVPAPPPPKQ